MTEQYIRAMQLIRSIGYTARVGKTGDYLVVEDGAEIYIIQLHMVQAWVRSH